MAWLSSWVVTILLAMVPCFAQTVEGLPEEAAGVQKVAVLLDGEPLFRVRGVSAFPAEKRAAAISERVLAAAKDRKYTPGSLQTVEDGGFTKIEARGRMLLAVTEADAAAEGISRQDLVRVLVSRIDEAIAAYRKARTGDAILRGIWRAGTTLAVFLASLFLFWWACRRVEAAVQRRCVASAERLQARGLPVAGSERFWLTITGALRFLRTVFLLLACLLAANIVFAQFPWTKPFSKRVFELLLEPLRTIWLSVVHSLPDLAFLAVLFVVFRYLLKLIRMIFEAIERGGLTFKGFDAEWAAPTFRIVRVLVIAFGAIVAYPYLPGSSSEAFKGISLFIGVLFSLGSTGVVANVLAGYSLTYRRAYRVGDRVRIGDTTGDVECIRNQVTHLRSVKNEEIIIPNSVILNNSVINYTSLAKRGGLILHTTVGIGYETPWRQVEAMLLMAAARTPGLLREPPPFVLHQSLGDFCVSYELNVYCDQPREQARLYTALHRNILDVFNEHGVQIMTPAYEADPEEPKIVPREKWFESPAKPEHEVKVIARLK